MELQRNLLMALLALIVNMIVLCVPGVVEGRDPTMSAYGRPDGTGFEGLLTFRSQNYSKFDRPRSSLVDITVLVHLESMRDISSDASMDFYLVQFWTDPRIQAVKSQLKVTGRMLPNDVWYPDTYFLLVRDLIYSDEEQYIVVSGEGSVEYNRKVKLSTPCSPNVMLFPFDVVRCTLVLTSFGYTSEEVNYTWFRHEDGGIGCYIDRKNNNVDHLGFYLMGVELMSGQSLYGGANYSSLETVIYLKRKYSAYVMQVYFPAALIVILSWTIFWINLHATPARASLGVTTVLTMLTLATQSTAHNEKHVNNKVTAIDIYLWVCFVFVIFAMIEFALSDFTTHRHLDDMSLTLRPSASATASGTNLNDINNKCILLVNQNANQINGNHRGHCSNSAYGGGGGNCKDCNSHSNTHRKRIKSNPIRPRTGSFELRNRSRNFHRTSMSTNKLHKQCNGYHVVGEDSPDSNQRQKHSISRQNAQADLQFATSPMDTHDNGTLQNGSVGFTLFDSDDLYTLHEEDSIFIEAESNSNPEVKQKIHSLNMINNVARVLFPAFFLAFNVVYWAALMIMIKTNESYKQSLYFTSLETQN